MDELQKLTNKLEYIFLKTIIDSLRSNSITIEESRSSAQAFLKLEPFSSIEDAKIKIALFVQQFQKFDKLKEYIDTYHDEQKINAVIEKMQKHIKENDVDKALHIAVST